MKLTFALVIGLALTTAFAADPVLKADRDSINAACTAEAATAGCTGEKVGTGLLKCIHAYHAAHKDFKPSDACKAAMMKLHSDKKAEGK